MVAPLLITNRSIFHVVLKDALVRTDEISALDPSWELPKKIKRQLEFMDACTKGRAPTRDEMMSTDVGPIAVRNFEESDAEYATWLKELDYAFRRWPQLP